MRGGEITHAPEVLVNGDLVQIGTLLFGLPVQLATIDAEFGQLGQDGVPDRVRLLAKEPAIGTELHGEERPGAFGCITLLAGVDWIVHLFQKTLEFFWGRTANLVL